MKEEKNSNEDAKWMSYRIRGSGQTITVWVNGVETANYTEAQDIERPEKFSGSPLLPEGGTIALQAAMSLEARSSIKIFTSNRSIEVSGFLTQSRSAAIFNMPLETAQPPHNKLIKTYIHKMARVMLTMLLRPCLASFHPPQSLPIFPMNFLTSVATIGLLSATSSHAILFGGFDYTLTMAEVSWEMAEAEAQAQGGHLASIHSEEEHNFIWETFGGQDLWIGFNDVAVEGEFVWSDGSSFDYSNFQPGDPNNGLGFGAENYGELKNGFDGMWNDATGDCPHFGVIKTPAPVSVPDTGGSLLLFGTGLAALIAAKKKARR